MKKMEILKFQVHSAQNVGKVWISRKKILLAPFGAIPGMFTEKSQNSQIFAIFLGGPMGPIHPVWGHVLVSFSICH